MASKKRHPFIGCRLSLSKNPFGVFRQFLQSAARIICSLMANKFHTCSLRSIFAHVQEVNCPAGARETALGCAAVKNELTFIHRYRGELCEAFLTV